MIVYFPIVHLREGLYQMSTHEWVCNLYKLSIVQKKFYNGLLAEPKIVKKFCYDS